MLSDYNVFKPVDKSTVPRDAKQLGSKWVFKTKRDQNGVATKHKARLVALGCHQREGIDYHETFAPVVRFSSIRLLVAVAAAKGWNIVQADIDKAYLHGDLEEELYMRVPTGIEGYNNRLLRLRRSIYGLKQAGRTWNEKITSSLKNLGFTQLISDHCVFSLQRGNDYYYIALYVDDLLFIGPDRGVIDEILDGLEKEYGVKRLGDAEYILGIQIKRLNNGSIALSQEAYINTLLERFKMQNARPASTPLPLGLKLYKESMPLDPDLVKLYRSIVGSLTYAMTGTRPDLAFAVGLLGRFNASCGPSHLKAAQHVLRHLAGTRTRALVYGGPGTPLNLQAFSDATWIDCPQTSRSTMGNHVTLGTCSITWASRQQARIALSTTDSEYMGMNDVGSTVIGVRQTLGEIGLPQTESTPLFNDNQGALKLAQNPAAAHRNRHMLLHEHLIRKRVDNGTVKLHYSPTTQLSANVLTKPLPSPAHNYHCQQLGLQDLDSLEPGGV